MNKGKKQISSNRSSWPQPPRADLLADLGKEYVIRAAKAIAPVVDDLADYAKELSFRFL